VAPWTFVGRETELHQLYLAATGSTGRGLIFGGAAGTGKSRLLREGTAALDPERWALVSATASAATAGLPLASLAPVLPAEQPANASATALLRWAADAVQRHGSGRPVVLAVDDVHLLDPLSAALVHQLARLRHAVVLGTLRTGAPVPDPVRSLWVDDLVDRVELGDLSPAETAQLLHGALGGPMEAASVDELWRLARGNALLLRELITAAVAADGMIEAYGVWRWNGRFALAPTLADVVDDRIGGLSPEVRDVLELVTFGAPLGLPLLVKATDSAAVEQAEERALITVVREDRRTTVRLAHPLYGEVIRKRCPLTRVRRLLADLAHLIEATGARRADDALLVAVWRLDSDTARDPRQLLRACQDAVARYELPLAARLGRAALAAGGGFAAAEALAIVLTLIDRPDEARDVLDATAGYEITDDDQRAGWLCARGFSTYWGHGDWAALDFLDRAASDLPGGGQRSRVRAVEAMLRLHHGDTAAVRRLASAVLDEPAADGGSRALSRSLLAHLQAAGGAPRQALLAIADVEHEKGYRRAETPYVQLAVDLARGTALALAADLPGLDDLGRPRERSERHQHVDFPLDAGYRNIVRAQGARLGGRLEEAGRLAAEACAILSPRQVYASLAHAERAHAAALTGNATVAAAAMADADRTYRPNMAILYPWLEQARAWTAVATGDQPQAVAILRRLVTRLRADGFHGHELIANLDLARLGVAAEAAQRVRWLAARTDEPLAETITWYVDAVAARDGAALLDSIVDFQERGLYLFAAEAAATAVSLLRSIRSTGAPFAADNLAKLLEHTPTARTPALSIRQPSLTPRERQIARLAAAGVSSKEIADQLYLSSRTVDNHLMRVYAKLGVSGRTELAAALRAIPGED
jgi:DNA-binding CsgD family transcriptional regulator